MFTRRTFLQSSSAAVASGLVLSPFAQSVVAAAAEAKKKLALITTELRYRSHSQHMGDRFLVGYPLKGKWHQPPLQMVSMYVDQHPANDLTRQRSEEFGIKVYKTIGEALRNGTDKLAVDAVLLIGEHGEYPLNEIGQKLYPRYEFFKQIVEVFEKDGRTVPVFNDKHLSWKWGWAKEMVEIARKMNFPFLAGSSLPVTWRMPAVDMPLGAEVEEVVCVAHGGVDVYDFHALETIQCMAERRRGGETGVKWMHAQQGDAVWQAMTLGSWQAGGWDPKLFEACLSRTQTLAQAREGFGDRYPTLEEMKALVKEPRVYRFEYNDGLKATLLMLNGLVEDFNFAARIKGQAEHLSTLFFLPPGANVSYSAILMSKAEEMFLTGKAPYPVERTLLTSGLVAAALQSQADGKPLETPHLAVRYQPAKESQFVRD